jgi:hypothetical protein
MIEARDMGLVSPSKIASHVPNSDPSHHDPFIGDLPDPVWNRDSSQMTRFPNQVDDRPVIFALLQMIQGQFGQLTTTQPTPE